MFYSKTCRDHRINTAQKQKREEPKLLPFVPENRRLVGLVLTNLVGAFEARLVEHDSEVALRRTRRQRTGAQRADVGEGVAVLELRLRNHVADQSSRTSVQTPLRAAAGGDIRQDLSGGHAL